MQMDAGLDTGDILLEQTLPIAADDTSASLHDKLAILGGELVVRGLAALQAGQLDARPQPAVGVTHAAKIAKNEAWIDWALPADVIARRIRAFSPWPGAQFALSDGAVIKVGAAQCLDVQADSTPGIAGQVLHLGSGGVDVRCGSGVLRLTRLQKPGGTMQPAAQGGLVRPGLVLPSSPRESDA
ncbi:methionyl-tRNA formyltransferase [mine drainage metagenome]|uniref:Methionyl-tRNA formyltransferase n=1 Tax=mine drainage metagenome TaxID=410659 RepID=A0A1J5PAE2_9ZZZZ